MFSIINNLLSLQGKYWKRLFFSLIPLNVVRSLFDVIGVSLIAPLIAVTTNPDAILDNDLFIKYNYLEINNPTDLIAFTGAAIIIFYLIRVIYSLYVIHLNNIFMFRGRSYLSAKLLEAYLNAEWSYHLKNNSSTLDSRVRFEANKVTSSMSNILKFLNELFFLVFSLILLLYTNFAATLAIFIIFFLTFGLWIFLPDTS